MQRIRLPELQCVQTVVVAQKATLPGTRSSAHLCPAHPSQGPPHRRLCSQAQYICTHKRIVPLLNFAQCSSQSWCSHELNAQTSSTLADVRTCMQAPLVAGHAWEESTGVVDERCSHKRVVLAALLLRPRVLRQPPPLQCCGQVALQQRPHRQHLQYTCSTRQTALMTLSPYRRLHSAAARATGQHRPRTTSMCTRQRAVVEFLWVQLC